MTCPAAQSVTLSQDAVDHVFNVSTDLRSFFELPLLTFIVLQWVEPDVTDNLGGIVDVSSSFNSSQTLSVYGSPYTVQYSATDASGNVRACSFKVRWLSVWQCSYAYCSCGHYCRVPFHTLSMLGNCQ